MLSALLQAYFQQTPDVANPQQQVSFGTSGHRGSSLKTSFNEQHVLAIAQAVADYRKQQGYTGPLHLGRDTHALSEQAWNSALSVLIANDIDVRIDAGALAITATPVISHAILAHNAANPEQLSDGLVITPSHNPPEDGGIKYNPAHGGPAGADATDWIQAKANAYLAAGLEGVKRVALEAAVASAEKFDYTGLYLGDLEQVVDLDAIRNAGIKLGVDPLGGAGLPVWQALTENTGIEIEVVNDAIDASFAFMPPDHDGKIRMDCSSPFAMENLLAIKDRFQLAFGNDPDADRHGIVDHKGLMSPNHFLAVCIDYLLSHRPQWAENLKIGKTLVSSSMIDRVVAGHQRDLYETPVGLKWFVDGLKQGWLAFGGEESAGATLLTRDGRPWSTDKDGIALCLLAAEIMAVTGKSPSEYYLGLTEKYGSPAYRRVDTPLTPEQKAGFKNLTAGSITSAQLAGEKIEQVYVKAPGNQASIGGIKVVTENGWFAARPSGTEPLYKIYAESFKGEQHLNELIDEARALLGRVL
ncbi:phosphoglucomutase [Oceanospirillum sanctuarii]|uniref:phosphoglucomutase n=1 Tax=Oceanospirillum sanctuarii TaxID=1434821 RepID=UPI000A35D84E|nr:phosphoglucomutase [Oceanospirillum sanctuarii]